MSGLITSIRANLVLVEAGKVRICLSLIPDGCAVSAIDLASLPTDGTPVVDDASGATYCVWELALDGGTGSFLAHARREIELAFFTTHEPRLRCVHLASAVAYSVAAFFTTVREARATSLPPAGGWSR